MKKGKTEEPSAEKVQEEPKTVETPTTPPVQESVKANPEPVPTQPQKKNNKKPIIILLILAFLCLCFAVIAGVIIYFVTRNNSQQTANLPELYITSPTGESWYSTEAPTISLEGYAASQNGINTVSTLLNGQKADATITGTVWTIDSLNLTQGDNTITVTATDKSGQSSSQTLTVVYNSLVQFSYLTASQDYIYTNEYSVPITINGQIVTTETIQGVGLYQIQSGLDNTKLVDMLDNGLVEDGDDIPSDNVYGGIYYFSATQKSTIEVRIGVDIGGQIMYSAPIEISAIDKPTEAQVLSILDFNTAASQQFDQLTSSSSPEAAAQNMAQWLSTQANISTSGTSDNGTGVWWVDKTTGILGGLENNAPGTRGSDNSNFQGSIFNFQSATTQPTIVADNSINLFPTVEAATNDPQVLNTKAIYLGPYLHSFTTTDDYYDGWKTIKDSKCPTCQIVEKKDDEVTVDDFKGLDKYGLVVVVSHGDTWFNGEFGANTGGKVVILTYQEVTFDNFMTYLPDLLAKRLAITGSGKYAILPSFITRYNTKFPNSLVYIGTCRSSYNLTMESAFVSKGALAYYGFSNYVDSGYAKNVAGEMIKDFVTEQEKAQDAFTNAVGAQGAHDNNTPAAYFTFNGTTNLVMGGLKFQNLGFEDRFDGWQTEGDARIITGLASLSPQEGTEMAIISTGLGSISDSNSAFVQEACVTAGTASISFKYDFVSEEPMEYFDSEYDDTFVMNVYINGVEQNLVNRTINNSSWNAIGGINFAGGDDTTFHTGWTTISQNLGEVEDGDVVKIEFRVSDKGDSIYDSAALIDDVQFSIE